MTAQDTQGMRRVQSAPHETWLRAVRDADRWRRIGGYAPALLLLPLIVLPLCFLVYGAFRSEPPGLGGVWTLNNFKVFTADQFATILRNSIVIGLGASAIGFLIGLILALAVVHYGVPGARILDSAILIPAYIPPFVGAIAWVFLLSPETGYINVAMKYVGLPQINIYSIHGIIFVMGLYAAPVAYLYIRPALLSLDVSMEEAARVFGANRGRTLRQIVLRLVMPALLSSLLVLFVTTLGEFAIPGVLGNQAHINVIATLILELTTQFPSDPGRAAVLGILLTVVTVVGLAVTVRAVKKGSVLSIGGRSTLTRGRVESNAVRYLATVVGWLYVLLSVVLPIFVLVVGSLQPYLSSDFSSGWTFSNYRAVWEYPEVARSIVNSLLLAALAAVCGVLLSAALAYVVVRRGSRIGAVIDYVASLPLAIPHVVFGLALLWAWIGIPIGVYGSRWVLLIAYVALFLPYTMRASVSGMQQLDPVLEEAAKMSGARGLRVARAIVLPLLTPTILSGATIILYETMREITASLLLYSPGNVVMPVAIWDLYTHGAAVGELFALCMLNMVLILGLVSVGNWLSRSQRRL